MAWREQLAGSNLSQPAAMAACSCGVESYLATGSSWQWRIGSIIWPSIMALSDISLGSL